MGADGLYVDSLPGEHRSGLCWHVSLILRSLAVSDYEAFLTTWEEKYGGPPPSAYHAMAYDAANHHHERH